MASFVKTVVLTDLTANNAIIPSVFNRGIRLAFNSKGTTNTKDKFDFSSEVNGAYSTVQNALVNLATKKESQKYDEEVGTDIESDLLNYAIASEEELVHTANFASLDTVSLLNSDIALQNLALNTLYDTENMEYINSISKLTLQPSITDHDRAKFEAQFTMSDDSIIGTTTTISI